MNRPQTVQISLAVTLSVAGALVGIASGHAAPSTQQQAVLLSPAEFPDYDAGVWREQRNGLANKSASRRLTEHPNSPEIADLLQQNRVDEALRVLRSIVDQYPETIPRAFEIVSEESSRFSDQAHGYRESVQELVDAARRQLPRLPREEAARAERRLLLLDSQPSAAKRLTFADQLRAFVQQYAGTETALLTEVDVMAVGLPIRQKLDALDKFIDDHPGTVAAAKALHQKGFQLSSGNVYPEIEARGADPTPRFFRVLEIVKELESGRYPPCEWVERAPTLVGTFFAYNPTYAPENIERQLDAYKEFAKTHFALSEQYPLSTGTGYIITTKMFDLFKRNGEGIAGVERVFKELEGEVPDVAAVQYLRAVFYVRSMNWEPAGERPAFYKRAIASLTRLQAQGNGLYHRKALATLASLYFSERHYVSARDHFKKYLNAYPDTAWAWVAALRIGQSSAGLGNWRAAVDAHLAATSKYPSVPFARVLGHAYAARGYEGLGQFNLALREYQAALAGWDKDYGPIYSLHVTQNSKLNETSLVRDRPDVSLATMSRKIAQLKISISVPGGALLERGRWLVQHRRHGDALVPLDQLLTRYRQSTAVSEARYLVHRARLGSALELADVANPKRKDAAALTQLELITTDPYDFGVFAAKIARASILGRTGAVAEADSTMMSALSEWYEHQSAQRGRALEGIDRDIADIRNLVIRPNGGGVFGAWGRNDFSRRRSAVPFVIVNPDVSLKLPDAQNIRRSVYQSLSAVDRVLFMNGEQQQFLNDIIGRLGGTPSEEPAAKDDIVNLWNKFFWTERRLGGVVSDNYPRVSLETYPIIAELEFLNAERTKAAARVVVGFQGGTILLEKNQGVWTAKALVNMWIS